MVNTTHTQTQTHATEAYSPKARERPHIQILHTRGRPAEAFASSTQRSASLRRLTCRICVCGARPNAYKVPPLKQTHTVPYFFTTCTLTCWNADSLATRGAGAALLNWPTPKRRPHADRSGFPLFDLRPFSELAKSRGVWEKFRQRGWLRACVAAVQSSSAFEWPGSNRPLRRCLLSIPM